MKRPVQSITQSIYLYGFKDMNAARNALKANAKNWRPAVIDAIKANDYIHGDQIDTIFNAGQLLHAKKAVDGRTVFISEDRFLYLSGYSYHGAGAGEQIESYIEYMRELSMQQDTIDASEINRIKSLTDF